MVIYGNPYDVIVPVLNSWLFKNPFDAYVCVRDCIYVILCISIERWRERIMKMQNDANTNIVCGTMICKQYRYIHMQMCKTPVLWEHFCEVSPVTQGDVRRFELVADTWLVSCGSVARGRLATASYIMSWKNCKNIYLESAPIPRPCAGV
jgi:hypothetical protein